MTVLPLQASQSASFVADGQSSIARVWIGPSVAGTKWMIKRITVSTNSPGVLDGASRCRVYLNTETPTALIGGTYSGDQDTNETDVKLYETDKLIVVWTGGDIGSIATVFVQGEYDTGR